MRRFERAQSGDRIHFSQAAVQAQTEAAKSFHMNKLSHPDTRHESSTDNRIIHVRNDTGYDIGTFCVISLDSSAGTLLSSIPLPTKAKGIVYAGIEPITTKKIAITQHVIPDGEVGTAVLYGVTPAYIDITDVDHKYCEVVDGEYWLQSTSTKTPIEILWHEGTTGTVKEAIVCIGGSGGASSIYGKVTADVTYTSYTGKTVQIYTGIGGDYTEEDWGDVCCDPSWIGSGKKIAADSMVYVSQDQQGNKIIVASPCPVTDD